MAIYFFFVKDSFLYLDGLFSIWMFFKTLLFKLILLALSYLNRKDLINMIR
jgi:hypothetical protein